MGGKSHGKTAMLIYEWKDYNNIGYLDNKKQEMRYICDKKAVADKLCTNSTLNEFIVHVPAAEKNTTSILTTVFDMQPDKKEVALYTIENTGYYCVVLVPVGSSGENSTFFEAWVEWKFPYGELPAVDYPKLLFYGIFSLVYLCVGLFWGIQSFRYWQDILPVQHFLSGAIFFLTVEMAFNFGFWEAYNQTGKPSWGLLGLVALLNAGRTSISFFMLLIVCMGYSVVRPSLGSTMKKCVILACTHFFFGVIYSLGTMLLSPETAGFLVLLVVFPLAITMTAFYVWTLGSITQTLATLEIRRQHVKALMYKRLYRLLVFSVLMVMIIFILNMFNFSDRTQVDWAARNWKRRWFMLDGWLNILYFIVFFVIIVLWRPTSYNSRYGLEQLSQDEEEAIALENSLRRAEGNGTERSGGGRNRSGRSMDGDDALFELGDDFSDDEHGHHKGQVGGNAPSHGNSPASDNRQASQGVSRTNTPKQNANEEESALLHVNQDDEDDEHLDDSEHAHLTANTRKRS
ncbi:lung seven transmembrane receptor-domain-containing protein [Phycomyces blakesleeanus]|uniref:Lung seven transmembrane receptor-domain-containing protein n=1 Tax=Phycomyces blakesleeanus TaxID=4837 RepID=A0ABR3B265_PHYBL